MKTLQYALVAVGTLSLAACVTHERTVVHNDTPPVVRERTVVETPPPVVHERETTIIER